MSARKMPVTKMFREWEGHAAAMAPLLGENPIMLFGEEGRRGDELVDKHMGEQAVLEQRMTATLDGTPAAAFCKLRVALANAEIVNSGLPGGRDPLWDMVQSAMEELMVAVTPEQLGR